MNWETKENKNFIQALLLLETPDEVRRFLRDLMTPGEIAEFAKRLKTAKMLNDKISYSLIEKETGFSSRTVARVSKWLNNGTGGYKAIINKIHHSNSTHTRRGLS